MTIIIANILRIIGAVFEVLADKSNNQKKIYLYNGIFNVAMTIQYYLLNAITGAISSFVCIFRNLIFYKFPKKVPWYILLIYLMIMIILNIPGYVGLISLMPILLVIIYTLGLYAQDIILFKYSVIIVCVLEIIYDIVYNAYIGIIICVIDIIFVTISLIKEKKKRKQKSIS